MNPATTLRVFAVYLLLLGAVLILVPNTLLGLFGMPPADDVWVRVVGMLAGILGYYYLRATAAGFEPFYAWTVPVRLSVMGFFAGFVLAGLAPPVLLLFAAIDAAAALWTWWAIRKNARNRQVG